jgi:hypothetical protein
MRCGKLTRIFSIWSLTLEISGRQGLVSVKKIKNNLLASVLILTVVPSSVKVGRGVIEQCYFLISQKLLEIDEVKICLPPSESTPTSDFTDISHCRPLRQDPYIGLKLWQSDVAPMRKISPPGDDRVHCKNGSID